MNSQDLKVDPSRRSRGFTLVEMLVVIAIMSVLMTAGAIGLSGLGGKGVSSGVSGAEALFDEARSIAMGQRTRTRVLVAKNLTNNPAENLRKMVVVAEELDAQGKPIANSWVLTSRGMVLPDQTFFSQDYSKKEGGGGIDEVTLSGSKIKPAFTGTYFSYEFNAEGISTTPGASFVAGAGARPSNQPTKKPIVTASAKRDFGGFVIWRNGSTSAFRSPDQMNVPATVKEF